MTSNGTTTKAGSQVAVILNGKNYCVEFRPDRHIKIVGQRRQFDLSSKNNAISNYVERWVKIDPYGKLGQKILLAAQTTRKEIL